MGEPTIDLSFLDKPATVPAPDPLTPVAADELIERLGVDGRDPIITRLADASTAALRRGDAAASRAAVRDAMARARELAAAAGHTDPAKHCT